MGLSTRHWHWFEPAFPSVEARTRGLLQALKIVALDLGKRRVGVAVGNDTIGVAVPVGAFHVRSRLEDEISALARFIAEYEPELLVVGDPVSLDGGAGPSALWARGIAAGIAEALSLRVVLIDERLTSREAAGALAEAGVRGRGARSRIDSAAAAVILEHYFGSGSSAED